jgi:hypothetical protein
MKQAVDGMDGPSAAAAEHQQVWETLPWLINGTASDEQRLRGLGHLAACEDCRQELLDQQRLQRAIALPDAAADAGAQQGLTRLLGRIEAQPLRDQPEPSRGRGAAGTPPGRRMAYALAAAVAMQAVGLAVLSAQLVGRDDASPAFRTLSQASAAPVQATLRVVPAPGLTLAEWQALLQVHGLRVVDGPSASGAYALAPAGGGMAPSEQLRRLRATPSLLLAESIGPLP